MARHDNESPSGKPDVEKTSGLNASRTLNLRPVCLKKELQAVITFEGRPNALAIQKMGNLGK